MRQKTLDEQNKRQAPILDDTPVLGVAEVADVLGWDRKKVTVYHSRGKLPPPLAELKCGPIWRREDIEAYRDDSPAPLPPSPDSYEVTVHNSKVAFHPWFETAIELLKAADTRDIPSFVKKEGRGAQALWVAAQQALVFAVSTVLDSDRDQWTDHTYTAVERAISLLNWRGGRWQYRVREGELCRRQRGRHRWEVYDVEP